MNKESILKAIENNPDCLYSFSSGRCVFCKGSIHVEINEKELIFLSEKFEITDDEYDNVLELYKKAKTEELKSYMK